MTRTHLCAALLSFTVILGGCKDSSYDQGGAVSYGIIDRSTSSSGKPDPYENLLITGRVGESTASGAVVKIYPFANGLPDFESPLATATTDAAGEYSFSLSGSLYDSPVIVRAEIIAGETRQRCAVVDGCGDQLPFGSEMVAVESSVLSVAVPQARIDRHYNLTLLSELAAEMAQSTYASGDDATATLIKITDANTTVASRFGIIGALAEFPVVDVASSAELKSADAAAVRYSAMGHAIVAAMKQQLPGYDRSALVEAFKSQYVYSGVADAGAMDSEISLALVYDELVKLIGAHQTRLVQLSGLLTELQATQALLHNTGTTELHTGTPSASNDLPALQRAKGFVQDIRQIAASLNMKKLSSFNDLSNFVGGDASEALAAFGVEIDAAELFTSDETKQILDVVEKALPAMMELLGATYLEDTIPDEIDGIRLSYSEMDKVKNIRLIDQAIDGCTGEGVCAPVRANMTANVTIGGIGGIPGVKSYAVRNASVVLTGQLRSGSTTLRFESDKQDIRVQKLNVAMGEHKSEQSEGKDLDLELINFELRLPISLIKTASGGAYEVSAVLIADVADGDITYVANTMKTPARDGTFGKAEETRIKFNRLASGDRFGFAGRINAPSGEDFQASINIRKDEYPYPGNAEYVSITATQCQIDAPENCQEISDESRMDGETEHLFLGVNATAVYKASLKGVVDPVNMAISVSRRTHERNAIDEMRVRYPGHAFSLKADFSATRFNALDAVSLDGARLAFGQAGGEDRSGAVQDYDGSIMAAVKDMGQWIKITFNDGYFEAM